MSLFNNKLSKVPLGMLDTDVQNKFTGYDTSLAEITYNVKNFGAKGDGVTDDLTAIQNALNAVGATGGTLLFHNGTFIVSNRLMVPSNVTLLGNHATIKLAPNIPLTVNGFTNWTGATILWLQNVSNVNIFNLELDGNMANQQTTANGIFTNIQIKGCNYVTVKGCTIHDAQYLGIQVTALDQTNYPYCQNSLGIHYLNVSENVFYNLQQSLQITESDTMNVVFDNNNIYNLTDHGMSCYPATRYISITNNKITNIGSDTTLHGACIRLLEAVDAVISNNIVENPHIHAIYVNTNTPNEYTTSNRVTISNNIVKGGARLGDQGGGIMVNGNNITISGNAIFDFTANGSNSVGIQVIGDYCTVTGNLINNANYGVQVDGNNFTIANNSVIDGTTYGIITGATNPSNGTINGNSVLGKNKTTLVGVRIQNNSNDTVVSANRISGATTTLQDTGTNTKLVVAPSSITKYTNYTVLSADNTILASASSGAITITLPDATKVAGRAYIIKKFDATANTVTVATTASQTIDGATTNVLSSAYAKVKVQSDGSNWWIV